MREPSGRGEEPSAHTTVARAIRSPSANQRLKSAATSRIVRPYLLPRRRHLCHLDHYDTTQLPPGQITVIEAVAGYLNEIGSK
jgi:hypothetical protein